MGHQGFLSAGSRRLHHRLRRRRLRSVGTGFIDRARPGRDHPGQTGSGGSMRFGLFTNGNRLNQIAKISYDADLQEIILADKLGMEEAWISEHGTLVGFQAPDQLPSADLFICKAAALTKRIKMGPGIRALPYYHPLQVATDAAVCDHLTGGRYMAGFGVGLGGGKGVQRGKLPGAPRAMFREAVDMILQAWESKQPFDWK